MSSSWSYHYFFESLWLTIDHQSSLLGTMRNYGKKHPLSNDERRSLPGTLTAQFFFTLRCAERCSPCAALHCTRSFQKNPRCAVRRAVKLALRCAAHSRACAALSLGKKFALRGYVKNWIELDYLVLQIVSHLFFLSLSTYLQPNHKRRTAKLFHRIREGEILYNNAVK